MYKPINLGGHAAYQAKMISLLKQYYPDAFTRFGPSLWDTIGKFYSMDLTQIDVIMQDCYSIFGQTPRLPSDIIRSMMVSLVMQKLNYTTWSKELKTNHLAAIIDLNERGGLNFKYRDTYTIGKDGIPVCQNDPLCLKLQQWS